ncbi:hypothetical protein [Nitrospirillum sp. BR 11163]|uniref:hypothetical protein n=1 Tax=Nitrospirillum sp. BR 11163 TaxID=3104323 RepID=UPI002AFF5D4B|nr:hypothetical protein [Nitrospirillum sp. BR 11163]MEA1674225.1 hypothetical protein [Nitrospirillum sp. BR 11163]
MPPVKKNPLNLNALQLKTLTLLQVLAGLEGVGQPVVEGGVMVDRFPHAHGNHFHLGPYTVMSADATGLSNQAAWVALERKGLIKSQFPNAAIVTEAGLAYDTGIRGQILHGSDH